MFQLLVSIYLQLYPYCYLFNLQTKCSCWKREIKREMEEELKPKRRITYDYPHRCHCHDKLLSLLYKIHIEMQKHFTTHTLYKTTHEIILRYIFNHWNDKKINEVQYLSCCILVEPLTVKLQYLFINIRLCKKRCITSIDVNRFCRKIFSP